MVLDEADEMLNMGFIEQVEKFIDYLLRERQMMLFSATMPSEVARLASFYITDDHVNVKMEKSLENAPKILHSYFKVQEASKEKLLLDLLTVENLDACIIFCNTKDAVVSVDDYLHRAGLPIDKIHGGMDQDNRLATRAKAAFERKINTKVARNKVLGQGITKVYFNGGEKKKLRAVDFVGTLTSIKDVAADDIGIIMIQENVTYIEILNGKGGYVIAEM